MLSELKGLEEMGVELLVCGTCLDFYKVRDRLGAGKVSNMFSILESPDAGGADYPAVGADLQPPECMSGPATGPYGSC